MRRNRSKRGENFKKENKGDPRKEIKNGSQKKGKGRREPGKLP